MYILQWIGAFIALGLFLVWCACMVYCAWIGCVSISKTKGGEAEMECPCCGYPMEYRESPFLNELGEPEAYYWVCADPKCGYTTDHNGNPIKQYEGVGV